MEGRSRGTRGQRTSGDLVNGVGLWRVSVDHDRCMGAGLCNGNLPRQFRLVNGKSTPLATRIEPDEDVLDAADFCPFGAIEVLDETTGRVVVPGD